MQFSTRERDHDGAGWNCASDWGGGWWYNGCARATLTGKGGSYRWYLNVRSLQGSNMMVRRSEPWHPHNCYIIMYWHWPPHRVIIMIYRCSICVLKEFVIMVRLSAPWCLHILLCHTANELVGISLVVSTGLMFQIYGCSRIYGARDVKGTALWRHENVLFLAVIASFSRTIFKRRNRFSRLNVFNVKFPLNWNLFPVYSFWINYSVVWSFY